MIDVIRAFTTACVLFAQGAKEITCVRDAAEAVALGGEVLVVGESGTEANIPGVIPNSPLAVAGRDLTARRIGLFTLNGTRALRQARTGRRVLAAAGVNATATAHWIIARASGSPIRLIVSDPDGPEDLACARYLAGRLTGEPVNSVATSREIVSAKRVHWDRWGKRATPRYWRRFRADVDLCARVDSLPIAMIAEVPTGRHPILHPVHPRDTREAA